MEEDPEPQTKPLTYDMVSNSADGYSYAVKLAIDLLQVDSCHGKVGQLLVADRCFS
jgi:hypothetical protein